MKNQTPLLVFILVFLHFNQGCASQSLGDFTSYWTDALCQTRPVDLLQLPEDNDYSGEFVELLDKDLFAPALYWRWGLELCAHKFSIPLPFSVRSIAYTRNHFYVIRDDVTSGKGNLYRIPDYELIGGFWFWSSSYLKVQTCNETWSTLCDLDFRTEEIISSISIHPSQIKAQIRSKFQSKLILKFQEVHAQTPETSKIWVFQSWTLCSDQRFTYVASAGGLSNQLAVLQPNYKPILLTASQNAAVVQTNEATHDVKLIGIQALNNFYGPDYLGLDVDGDFHVFYDKLQVSQKLGKFFPRARRFYVLSNSTMMISNAKRRLSYSEEIISDYCTGNHLCGNFSITKTGGCISAVFVDPRSDLSGLCQNSTMANNTEALDTSELEILNNQNKDWIYHEGRMYRIFTNPVTYDEAASKCSQYASESEVVHLAAPKTLELQLFLIEKIDFIAENWRVWIAGGLNSTGVWTWLDGEQLPVVTKMQATTTVTFPTSTLPQFTFSGSGDFETTTTTAAPVTTTEASIVSNETFLWRNSFNGSHSVENLGYWPDDGCLILGASQTLHGFYGFDTLDCEMKSAFICEKYPVQWDIRPNRKAFETSDPDVLDLGLLSGSNSDPGAECALMCQQSIRDGCFSFTVTDEVQDFFILPVFPALPSMSNDSSSSVANMRCYGRSNYNMNGDTPDQAYISGTMMAGETFRLFEPAYFWKRYISVSLSEDNVLSGWNCSEGGNTAEDPCYQSGCVYDAQTSTCFMKFVPMTVNLTDHGCWTDDVSNPLMTSLEGFLPYLDGAHSTRKDALLKCMVAAKLKGLSLFALQDGGRCMASNASDLHFASMGASSACKSDGRGGVAANQVYEITGDAASLRRARGPITFHPTGVDTRGPTRDANGKAVMSTQDIDLIYLVYQRENANDVSFRFVNEDIYMKEENSYWMVFGSFDEDLSVFTELRQASYNNYELVSKPNRYLRRDGNFKLHTIIGVGSTYRRFTVNTGLVGCETRPRYRRAAPAYTTQTSCLAAGHCWLQRSDHIPDCFKKKLKGTLYTDDGWTKSVYSSYEYALISLNAPLSLTTAGQPGTFIDARAQCQEEGGDIAYVGFDERVEYNFIKHMVLLHITANHVFNHVAYIGVTDETEEGRFRTLHGKDAILDWHGTEPNGGAGENHAVHATGGLPDDKVAWDLGGRYSLSFALCQRIAGRCEIAVGSRVPCLGIDSMTSYTKIECIHQGCCYEEALDGSTACYRDYETELYVDPDWLQVPFNNYEYKADWAQQMTHKDAQELCWSERGDSAYYDLSKLEVFDYLSQNLLITGRRYATGYEKKNGQYESLNGEVLTSSWATREPQLSDTHASTSYNKFYGNGEAFLVYPFCQRMRDDVPYQIDAELKLCETNYSMCERNRNECNVNATCIDQGHLYECVCHEGFTGDGKDCFEITPCPDGWIEENLGCYLFQITSSASTIYDLNEICRNSGGDILSIASKQEEDFITGWMNSDSVGSLWLGMYLDQYTQSYFWLDDSICEYGCSSMVVQEMRRRCAYLTPSGQWIAESCFGELPVSSTHSQRGYVCKINQNRTAQLRVEMSSYPWDMFPGFAELKINAVEVPGWIPPTWEDREEGCIHATGLNRYGEVMAATYDCGAYSNNRSIEGFAQAAIKEEYDYLMLAKAGNNRYLWDILVGLLSGNPNLTLASTERSLTESTTNRNGSASNFSLPENELLYFCEKCTPQINCNGVKVTKEANGSFSCVPELNDDDAEYQYKLKALKWDDDTMASRVHRRTQNFNVDGQVELACPWFTEEGMLMDVNATNRDLVEYGMLKVGVATCQSPCLMQMVCISPKIPDDDTESAIISSVMMFCERSPNGGYTCPVNVTGAIFGDPVRETVDRITTRQAPPVLATFDDLVHLGSPPLELSLEKNSSKVEWMPLLWRWKERRYARLVTGVVGRALRFKGQAAFTTGDICWGKLGVSNRCKDGLTVSFWVRLMSWPTSDELKVINTVDSDPSVSCSGFSVFVTSRRYLTVVVYVDNTSEMKSVLMQYRKWTKVWFSWSPHSKLSLYLDSIEVNTLVQHSFAMTGSLPTCDHSTLTVGSTSDEGYVDGQFDIDELVIQNEYLSLEDSKVFTGTEPFRHKLSPNTDTLILKGSQQCNSNTVHHGCGRFPNKCPGNGVFCYQGFVASVVIKIRGESTVSFSGQHDHILVLGNLPHDVMVNGVIPFGFRLQVRRSQDELAGTKLWDVTLIHKMKSGGDIGDLTWQIRPNTRMSFWVRYHENGRVAFCKRWPTYCKTAAATAIESFSQADYVNADSYSEMVAGPVKVTYSDGQPEVTNDATVEIIRPWFIEQSLDLIMAADEFSEIGTPRHWQVTEDNALRERDVTPGFEAMGNTSRITSYYSSALFNRHLVVSNPYNESNTDEWHYGWLQMEDPSGQLGCLGDPHICYQGFTLQFWFKLVECHDTENGCYIISSGAAFGSYGFNFYALPPDHYVATVSTVRKLWKLKFELVADEFTLIRISWQADIGLSLFVNEIPVMRTFLWTNLAAPEYDPGNRVDVYDSLTIGRRNDRMAGFGSFVIGEIHFWEALVEGMPFITLGDGCMQDWTQIGEGCYKFLTGQTVTQISQNPSELCSVWDATLPQIFSWSEYLSFGETTITNAENVWLDLVYSADHSGYVWNNTQRYLSDQVFSALIPNIAVPADGARIVFERVADIGEFVWGSWKTYSQATSHLSTTQLMCWKPLVKDPFLLGCTSRNGALFNDFSWDEHNLTEIREGSGMNFSTYQIPAACRRICASDDNECTVIGVSGSLCLCFEKRAKREDVRSNVNRCTALPINDHISSAFSFGATREYKTKMQCGTPETGGSYRCAGETTAAIYAFSERSVSSDSQAPLSSFDVNLVLNSPIEQLEVVQVGMENIKCCKPHPDDILMAEECSCGSDLIFIRIDFGDGNTYEGYYGVDELSDELFEHFYDNYRTYTVAIAARNQNAMALIERSAQIDVIEPIDRPILLYVEMETVVTGQFAQVSTEAVSGSSMTCAWQYSDGSPLERQSVNSLPIPDTHHRFQSEGVYDITVTCWNRLHSESSTTLGIVQTPVSQLAANNEATLAFGETFSYTWTVAGGSHVECRVTMGGQSIGEVPAPSSGSVTSDASLFYYDSALKRGYAQITRALYAPDYQSHSACLQYGQATTFTVVLTCYNTVTLPIPSVVTYVTFEVPVQGFEARLVGESPFRQLQEEVCFAVEVAHGSNILLEWDFGDEEGSDKNFAETCGADECFRRNSCTSYSISGIYHVVVIAMNALGSTPKRVEVMVENPLVAVQVRVSASPIPGRTSSLEMSHQRPLPSGSVDVNFGDGTDLETHTIHFDEFTAKMTISHEFQGTGFYEVFMWMSNNVSSVNTSARVQIGYELQGSKFYTTSSRNIRAGIDQTTVHAEISSGSEPIYTVDFGDNSNLQVVGQNLTRGDPGVHDLRVFTHTYHSPGEYQPSLMIRNVFGDVSLKLPFPITVQNPLSGGSYTLVEDPVVTVAYPPGTVELSAHLEKAPNFPDADVTLGYANNVSVIWRHFDMELLKTQAEYEKGLFPMTFTFIKRDVGEVKVTAELSNLVSSHLLDYSIQVLEVVGGVSVELSTQETTIGDIQNGQFVMTSTNAIVTFRVAVSIGSHVKYTINYGDEEESEIDSPVLFGAGFVADFKHSYYSPGVYSVTVVVSNLVSSVEVVLTGCVQVYDEIVGPQLSAQYIDLSEDSGFDVFLEGTELYNVFYGKLGTERFNVTQFPLNRATVFHFGILQGTNVTTVWRLLKENTTVTITEDSSRKVTALAFDEDTKTEHDITERPLLNEKMRIKFVPNISPSQLQYLGQDYQSVYQADRYTAESSIAVNFVRSGTKLIGVGVTNAITSSGLSYEAKILAEVSGISFVEVEPPVTNRTARIKIIIQQFGTDSCFLMDPGDISYRIAFGVTPHCVSDSRIEEEDFHLIVSDQSAYTGRNISEYEFSGQLDEGTGSINFTLLHEYTQAGLVKVKISGFNSVSEESTSLDLAVTELLCDYPYVEVEKNKGNSRHTPRKIASFLEFRLYSVIRPNCKSTSRFLTRWDAYDVVGANSTDYAPPLPHAASRFEDPDLRFLERRGLLFTPNSESVAIEARFFPIGMHLVCLNVAMDGVEGVNASDCIFIEMILPPLVAAVEFGVRRTVGHGSHVDVDAESSSYDPDLASNAGYQTNSNLSRLQFVWSCPQLVQTSDIGDGEDFFNSEDDIALIFGGKPEWKTSTFCQKIELNCPNSYRGLEFDSITNFNDSFQKSIGSTELIKLQGACSDSSQCNVAVNHILYGDPDSNSFQLSGDNSTYCVNVTHQCALRENSTTFDFYSSNSSCIASGYYPKLQKQSTTRCDAIQSFADTCGYFQVNTTVLTPGSTYAMRVRVSDPKTGRVADTYQLLQVTSEEPPKIKITCKFNCNLKTNTRTSLVLHVTQNDTFVNNSVTYSNSSDFGNTSSVEYTWLLYMSNGVTTRRNSQNSNEQFERIDSFAEMTSTGIHRAYLVIKPHALTPGKKYRIRASGKIPNTTPGLTEIEIMTNLPPYGGHCDVDPNEGVAMNDTFTINCPNWRDEGLNVDRSTPISANEFMLLYQVYIYTSYNATPSLLSFGNNPLIPDKNLPSGTEENDYEVLIQIRVLDEYGESAVVNNTIRVFAPEVISNEELQNVTSSEVASSNSQVISQLSSAVAGLLNVQGGNQTNTTDNESEVQAKQQRSSIRTNLVDAVVSRINPQSDLDGILQSSNAISGLTEVVTEVDDDTQTKAVGALSDQASTLMKLSESKPSEDVAATASVMVIGIDNVMKASRQQLLANSGTSTSGGTTVTSFASPQPSGASTKAILDEEESFLSPEEREERRTIELERKTAAYSRNRNQSRLVGSQGINSVTTVTGAILRNKVPGEPSLDLASKGFQLKAQRTSARDLCHKGGGANANQNSDFLSNSKIQLTSCGESDDSSQDEEIDAELLTLDENPYVWDDSADNVRSPVVSLTFKFQNGSKPFQNNSNVYRLELPVDPALSSAPPQLFNFTPTGAHQMSYHEFKTATSDDVTFITILPQNTTDDDIRMRVYFLLTDKLDTFPSIENNTFVLELPDHSDPVNQFRLRINGSHISPNSRYVFGIHQIDEIGNVTSKENETLPAYLLSTVITSCRFWNETTEKWETAGCEVSSESTSSTVVCLCTHLTSFGAGFFVAPNPIDFASLGDKLQNLKDNLAVLLTLVFLLLLYVAGIIACRRQDKKDVKKWSIALLMDNKLNGEYFYQVTVKTGWTRDADTKSRVRFVLSGDKADTKVRVLADSQDTEFTRGSVRKFLMVEERALGMLSCIKIWHDNSGAGSLASWFLDHIIITDLQTNKKFYFMCDDWLAVDESDGSVERLLPVAGDEQIGSFKNLFTSSAKRDFSDGHLWFSILSRPTKSTFTRVQRLSCAFVLLLSTMLTSAMFFGREGEDSGQQGRIDIGPITITVQQLIISIQASLIVLPVNILLVQIFRNIAPKSADMALAKNVREILQEETFNNLQDNEVNENANGDTEEKPPRQLPHWFLYVGWGILVVTAAVSASFVFIYSVDWGAQKANDWLLSIVLSFTQSIFVIQPAKVIIGAVVVSFVINQFALDKAEDMVQEAGADEINAKDLKQKEEEWLVQCPLEDDYSEVEASFRPDPEKLALARKAREHHKHLVKTMHDIGTYVFYVILLLIATNVAKDPNSYRLYQSMSRLFLESDPAFLEVRTVDDFWSWCDDVLVEGLHASDWYNGKRVTWMESRFLSNRQTFVIGPARIRQLRAHEGFCVVNNTRTGNTMDCVDTYSIVDQETAHFTVGWKSRNETNETETPWSFQNFLKLGGHPYSGLIRWYDGGGYSATLGNTAKSSRKILDKLKRNSWIDRQTAAIFVEFTVYNANINLFATNILLLERSSHGAFFGFPSITALRLYEFIDGKGTLLIGIYVTFVIVLLYKMYHIIRQLRLNGMKFFRAFWNGVDFISAVASLIAIAMFGVRTINLNLTLEKIMNDVDKETFVNFQYIALWNDSFRYSMAFTLFLATIKFNQLLAFNQRIRLLAYTLGHAAKPIAYFLASFSIYFAAFLFLGFIWFEQKLYPYSTLYLTAEEMLSMLLGRFDFTKLKMADQVLGPFFFIAFAGCCTILLINMFVVILDDSIKAARKDVESAKNEFEMVEYIKQQITCLCYSVMPKWMFKTMVTEAAKEREVSTPIQELERRIDILASYVRNMEIECYADVSIEELQQELEEENEMDDVSLISYGSAHKHK